MSARILINKEDQEFCFYNSVTGHAFGHVLSGDINYAEAFLEWLCDNKKDPTLLNPDTLITLQNEFEGDTQ